jgi:hypothetical protein
MDQEKKDFIFRDSHTQITLENLIAPDPDLRENALEELESLEGFKEQPLMVYLLATRLLDPDLEIRFHAVQILGKLLDFDPPAGGLPDKSLKTLTEFTTQLEKEQLIKLLEVSVGYLAAEESIVNILKLCSYAGKALGGIVNDRKLPVEVRQQAIYFCGEVGFLSTETAIRNLIQRIGKEKARPGLIPTRRKHLDEKRLLPFAVAALTKLEES